MKKCNCNEEQHIEPCENTCDRRNHIVKQFVDECSACPIDPVTTASAVFTKDCKTVQEVLDTLKAAKDIIEGQVETLNKEITDWHDNSTLAYRIDQLIAKITTLENSQTADYSSILDSIKDILETNLDLFRRLLVALTDINVGTDVDLSSIINQIKDLINVRIKNVKLLGDFGYFPVDRSGSELNPTVEIPKGILTLAVYSHDLDMSDLTGFKLESDFNTSYWDLNKDGKVDVSDMILALNIIAKLGTVLNGYGESIDLSELYNEDNLDEAAFLGDENCEIDGDTIPYANGFGATYDLIVSHFGKSTSAPYGHPRPINLRDAYLYAKHSGDIVDATINDVVSVADANIDSYVHNINSTGILVELPPVNLFPPTIVENENENDNTTRTAAIISTRITFTSDFLVESIDDAPHLTKDATTNSVYVTSIDNPDDNTNNRLPINITTTLDEISGDKVKLIEYTTITEYENGPIVSTKSVSFNSSINIIKTELNSNLPSHHTQMPTTECGNNCLFTGSCDPYNDPIPLGLWKFDYKTGAISRLCKFDVEVVHWIINVILELYPSGVTLAYYENGDVKYYSQVYPWTIYYLIDEEQLIYFDNNYTRHEI